MIPLAILASLGAAAPNVVIVMTDDQGYAELSCNGNPIVRTPNIDALCGESVSLGDFHSSPMSTPSRGQLLTGVDALRNGAANVSSGRTLLRLGIPTIGEIFSQAGYSTALFGKWHLGDNYPYRPEDRGFRETLWFPSSHIGSVPDYWGNDRFDDVYIRNGERTPMNGYCTDVFFDETMKWMEERAEAGEPFLAYLMPNAPHGPFTAPQERIDSVRERVEKAELCNLTPKRREDLVKYLAMIECVDDKMGELMDFLRSKGIADNTILIFMTDNGCVLDPYYPSYPQRGRKAQLYEGGHRVPCYIRYPQGIEGGRTLDGLTQMQDILPTLMELCGIKRGRHEFDGISLAKALEGKGTVPANRTICVNYSRMPTAFTYPSPYGSAQAREDMGLVMWKRWRLVQGRELYNLDEDPLQKNNVIGLHPEIAASMARAGAKWWKALEADANRIERNIVGVAGHESTLLTACDWVDVFVDQQEQVKKGTRRNSYWMLDVATAGKYRLELRRWPSEFDQPIGDGIAAARIFIHTEEGDIVRKNSIREGEKASVFECELPEGPAVLHSWFEDSEREPLFGAYYVRIELISGKFE